MPDDRQTLFEALDRIRNLQELGHLVGLLHQLRISLSSLHLAYHGLFIPGRFADDGLRAATYSKEWEQRENFQKYLIIHPAELAAGGNLSPIDWNAVRFLSKETASFFAEAERYGVGHNGISIPLNDEKAGLAIFTVTSNLLGSEWDAFKAQNLSIFVKIGKALRLKILELTVRDLHGSRLHSLTEREIEYLALYIAGREIKQISDLRSVSDTAVRRTLNSATEKLGARSPRHAGYRAIALGIVSTCTVEKFSRSSH